MRADLEEGFCNFELFRFEQLPKYLQKSHMPCTDIFLLMYTRFSIFATCVVLALFYSNEHLQMKCNIVDELFHCKQLYFMFRVMVVSILLNEKFNSAEVFDKV